MNLTTLLDFDLPSTNRNQTIYNFTELDLQFGLWFKLLMCVFYNIVFFLGFLGNAFVIYLKCSSGVKSVTNSLIINLAMSDLLMVLMCIPFTYFPIFMGHWPFGVLCYVINPFKGVTIFVSAYTLIAMACDRYMVILHPLRPRLRRGFATPLIFFIWISAICTSIPIMIKTDYFYEEKTNNPQCDEIWGDNRLRIGYSLLLMFLQYVLPLSVFIYTYSRIILYMTVKKIPGERAYYKGVVLAEAKKKTVVIMSLVISVYTICWGPINCLIVLGDFGIDFISPDYADHVYTILHCFALSHTVWNPIIYSWMDSNFRMSIICFLEKSSSLRRIFRDRGSSIIQQQTGNQQQQNLNNTLSQSIERQQQIKFNQQTQATKPATTKVINIKLNGILRTQSTQITIV